MACIMCQSCDTMIDLDFDVEHEEHCAEDQAAMWERSGISKPMEAKIKESAKSPEMTEYLEFNFGRSTAIARSICTSCKKGASTFKDELSKKEYSISGLCQTCQDAVFNV